MPQIQPRALWASGAWFAANLLILAAAIVRAVRR